MTEQSEPRRLSDIQIIHALEKQFEITLEDISSHWIDLMSKRLRRELNRQLCQVEAQKAETSKPGDRTENARVLASLQNTMEKLVRMEAQRDARRKGKNITKDADARKALERKLDKLASARAAQKPR
jgi:CRP-like cAMP-binding protein